MTPSSGFACGDVMQYRNPAVADASSESGVILFAMGLEVLSCNPLAVSHLLKCNIVAVAGQRLVSQCRSASGLLGQIEVDLHDGACAAVWHLDVGKARLQLQYLPLGEQPDGPVSAVMLSNLLPAAASRPVARFTHLTPRERNLVAALAEGRTVSEIAIAMQVKAATIRQYLKNIYAKTGVSSQSSLVSWYYRT